jgi:hypothetical protein
MLKDPYKLMRNRARDAVMAIRESNDPKGALCAVAQCFAEVSECLERYPADQVEPIWTPALLAAFDGLEALKKKLDNDPDLQKEIGQEFDMLYSAVQEELLTDRPWGTVHERTLS